MHIRKHKKTTITMINHSFIKGISLLGAIFFQTIIYAQTVSTFAGSGSKGSANGTGISAEFNAPRGIALDGAGNVYVADNLSLKIRKITPAGVVTTLAGSGISASINGTGAAASFTSATGIAVDISGNVYVVESLSNKIRKITSAGDVTTFAGSGNTASIDGIGTAASFSLPMGIAVDQFGVVYITEFLGSRIRKISPSGIVTTIAGSGIQGSTDGPGLTARFDTPHAIAVDNFGFLYVADTYSNKIRKITPWGDVTTLAGSGSETSVNGQGAAASFLTPTSISVDLTGNVYVGESRKLRKVTASGAVTNFAGSGGYGSQDGPAATATLDAVYGLASNTTGEIVYFADNTFNKIRKVVSCNSTIPQTPVVSVIQPNTTTPTGSITMTSPLGAFQYSIDNINYQGGTTFNNLSPGNYQITARKTGSEACVSLSKNVTINNSSSQNTNGMISAGRLHSLALCSNNTISAWGVNANGQFGNGTYNSNNNVAVQINSLTGITAIAGGEDHTLALKLDGTVWAFGHNPNGQLGNGTNTQSNIPVLVNSLTNIIAIAGGSKGHSLALKDDGSVWDWGNNSYGQLGNGNYLNSNVPVQVIALSNIIAIAGGGEHSLALKNDGTVWAWGFNFDGQLGNGGTPVKSNIPIQVSNLTGIIAIASGGTHSLALKSDGTVWAWGNNIWGALGNGTNTASFIPVQVSLLTEVIAIAANHGNSSLALKSNGTVWEWGDKIGIYGTTIKSNIPLQENSLSGIIAIAAGGVHCIAKKNNGTIWAWGNNLNGVLGDGTYISSSIPVQVTGLCNTLDIEENLIQNSVLIYPNPSKGIINVELNDVKETELTLYNAAGQKVLTKKINEKNSKLELNKFTNGIYFLNFKNIDGASVQKIILDK